MKPLAAFVVAAVVLTSCSGDDDTAPTVSSVSSTTVVATTAPTTHQPATTGAPTTTAESTTTTDGTPTTAVATVATASPTTDELDPIEDLAAAIQRDLTAGNELLAEVLADPSAEDAEQRLRRYFAAGSLEIVLGFLEDFRSNDFIIVPNPDVPSQMVIQSEPQLEPDSNPPRVAVRTCEIDADVVMGVLAESDVRFPLDDEVYRYITDSELELADGTWKLAGGELVSEETGVRTCE